MRASPTQKDSFCLSLRDSDDIKHYRIKTLDNGRFYIAYRISFPTLQVNVGLRIGVDLKSSIEFMMCATSMGYADVCEICEGMNDDHAASVTDHLSDLYCMMHWDAGSGGPLHDGFRRLGPEADYALLESQPAHHLRPLLQR